MSTKSSVNPPKNSQIAELDGVRGILSIWVVFYHSLTISGLYDKVPEKLASLLDGSNAVKVFIIMSGFVITRLILISQESYTKFILRRWLRLYPTYAIAIILSVLLQLVGWMPIRVSGDSTLAYAISHITMLFGALPNGFPGAGSAILNPTWSISLEWQFYLIAPLLIGMFKGMRSAALISAICLSSSRIISPLLYHMGLKFGSGFIVSELGLFWVGMVSFLLYRYFCIDQKGARSIILSTFFGALIFLPYEPNIGVLTWLFILLLIFFFPQLASRFFANKHLVYLGAISYPVYLLHEPFMWAGVKVAGETLDKIGLSLLLFVGSLIIVLPLSGLVHSYVEKPIIRWGKSTKT